MKVVLFGMSPFSKLVKHYIQSDSDDTVVAFTVDREYALETEFDGIPVIPFDELDSVFLKTDITIIVTCGYKKLNQVRKEVFARCKSKGYQIGGYIHSTAQIEIEQIGQGNIILPNARIAPFVKLGNGNIIFNDVMINHETSVGDYNYFAPGFICGGLCTIGSCNFFGLKSTLRDSITVGNSNLVGASAYLPKSIGSNQLVKPASTTIESMNERTLQDLL